MNSVISLFLPSYLTSPVWQLPSSEVTAAAVTVICVYTVQKLTKTEELEFSSCEPGAVDYVAGGGAVTLLNLLQASRRYIKGGRAKVKTK